MSLQAKSLYDFGSYRLDARERVLFLDGEVVPLAPKAIDLLVALVENGGHVLSKDDLMKQVWPDSFVEEANLSHHIFVLRKALNEDKNSAKYIETLPRRGYRFVARVTEIHDSGSNVVGSERTRSHIVIEEEQEESSAGHAVEVEQTTVAKASGNNDLAEIRSKRRITALRPVAVGALIALSVGAYFWMTRRPKSEAPVAAVKSFAVLPFKPLVAGDLKKAIIFFQQATEKDPSYALAYTGLAHTYNVLGLNFLPPREVFPEAKAAATKALKLDPTLAEAQAALGAIHLFYEFNWLEAERELRLAIDLNPNYATAHELYGYYLAAMGRIEESVEQKKRALELDPLSLVINDDLAAGFYYARQYDQAVEQVQKTIELDPNFAGGHFWLGLIYAQKGRTGEAIAEANQAISSSGESQNTAMLGQVYALLGKKNEARKVITDLTEQSKRRYVSPSDIARIYAALGDKEQSISWLAKAYEERAGWIIYLKVEPIFDSLRSDQRFTHLLRRMNFQL